MDNISSLKRHDLQRLCKELDLKIKRNKKNVDLISAILDYKNNNNHLDSIDFIGINNGVNYLNILPNIILKIIVEHCSGTDCKRLYMTCKTIQQNIIKVLNVPENLITFIDPNLELEKIKITTLSRWFFWKNNYICFPSIKFTALANGNHFRKATDHDCLFKEHYFLNHVWWLEMGDKNIKNVPIAEYDIYWRVKLASYTKPIMFHCSVLIGNKVHSFSKGILDEMDLTPGKWCIYKTNSITLPKEILDAAKSNSNTSKTMSVKCSLFNINAYSISGLSVDCFHLVPKGNRIHYNTQSHRMVSIDQVPYDPHDRNSRFSPYNKQGIEEDYFERGPGVYDYDQRFGFR